MSEQATAIDRAPAPSGAAAARKVETVSWVLLALAIAGLPFFGSVYTLYMACLIGINVIATVGLNITVGYTGLLSVGHSAFLGVGAYVSALMWLHLDTPLALNIVGGAVAAFLVGIVFGLPALRIKGVYLAIATLAAQYMLYFVFQQWTPVTGGDRGLSLPKIDVFGLGDDGFYYVVAGVAFVTTLAARNLFRTRVGRSFIAVREKDYASEVLGINVVATKLVAFGLGAAYAGAAGALLAVFLRIVNPDQFTLQVSIFFLAAVVVGGRASILGSILGALFMTLMPEFLRFGLETAAGPGADLAGLLSPLREIIFGALIIGFLIFEPRGLVGLLRRAFGQVEEIDANSEH
ncbi:branched-chain amino acid ABC transporter permease [Amorphus orientalis]|uniref:Branched-chain amino acid transport system permease protein n=1 Tax=Amorphus orientalis TaxID=649198 RepID=A0AAE3VPE4_9HYPH|nr:branched-chain amino acid ABC transporter permease [Amorphus orientalis]MDQ0315803.1 branched-chain amino acid transport system permease protein [Amorphus orientalis]